MNKNKKTVAICGIGYVGFPVAMLFAEKGFNVIGVDIDEKRVKQLNKGENPIKGKEPGLSDLVASVHKSGNFKATTDPHEYSNAQYIIISVQTPVGERDKSPKYTALRSAITDIGKHLSKGTLVIVESTTAPGTMMDVVKPILEKESSLAAGKDFLLANCPERLMPGYLLENISEYNRVIGGFTPKAADAAEQLYKTIVRGKLDKTDCTTAEVVKTGENTYRDVQIAFANEMALLCEAMGSNVWVVRELINKCKKITDTRPEAMRQMHFPGAGVGGHCIPKDSWLLINKARSIVKPQLIPIARAINDFMPTHMFELLKTAIKEAGKDLNTIKIAVLGYAYDGNSDDDRNTPTKPLLKHLEKQKVEYEVHDPYIAKFPKTIKDVLNNADALILMTAHDEYKQLKYHRIKALMNTRNPIIIDGRNVFDKNEARNAGFLYKGVGNV